MKPILLDLYCGAGGAGEGYARAGFRVIGVDVAEQPRYPFDFRYANALDVLAGVVESGRVGCVGLHQVDAIHASPPCQAHSRITKRWSHVDHVDLIAETRELLDATGLPYIIENVPGAPLRDPVTLCGSSFGLDVRRHRLFESNVPLVGLPCDHAWQTPRFPVPDRRKTTLSCVVPVYGHPNYAGDVALWRRAMGIDWMTAHELAQAIPPAYTHYLGLQLVAAARKRRALSEVAA